MNAISKSPKKSLVIVISCALLFTVLSSTAKASRECSKENDAYCRDTCHASAQWLTEPLNSPFMFLENECMQYWKGSKSSIGCACYVRRADMPDEITYFSLHPGLSDDPCLVYGRACNCIYQESDFPGCSLDEAETGCVSICEELEQLIIDDYAFSFDAKIHGVFCDDKAGRCRCVLEIEGMCYVYENDIWCTSMPYECSMSAEEIWKEYWSDLYGDMNYPEENGGCGCGAYGERGTALFFIALLFLGRFRFSR